MRKNSGAMLLLILLLLCGCSGKQTLPSMETVEGDGYMAILWEGRTYVPFCVVSKADCGAPVGCIDGNTEDIVSVYKDYPPEAWIANYLTVDGGAILYKEEQVTVIPEGLEPEYVWNS